MSRPSASLVLMALLALLALVAASSTAGADEVDDDDYYEDEYDDDTEEPEEEPEAVKEELPWRLQYARSGFYLYGGGGGVFLNSAVSDETDIAAVKFSAGFRFLRYGAAEVEYQVAPNWRVTLPSVSGSDSGADLQSFMLNAKGYFPWGRLQPFAQAGIGIAMVDVDGNDFDTQFSWRVGGGLELFVTEHLAFSLLAVQTWILDDFVLKPVPTVPEQPRTIDKMDYTSVIWSIGYHF